MLISSTYFHRVPVTVRLTFRDVQDGGAEQGDSLSSQTVSRLEVSRCHLPASVCHQGVTQLSRGAL